MLRIETRMGGSQSQELQQYVTSNINTTSISSVISRYATRTNAIVTNVQDMNIVIEAKDIKGPIDISQEIESIIDVQQMVDRSNQTQLMNDLKTTLADTLQGGLSRITAGIDILSKPENQRIVSRLSDDINTYVSNTITTDTVDTLLLSASNYQKGRLYISADLIEGPISFNQRIQSNLMAENMIKQAVNTLVKTQDAKDLSHAIQGDIKEEESTPISGLSMVWKWARIIGGILLFIVGLILILTGIVHIIVPILVILVGSALIVWGIWRW